MHRHGMKVAAGCLLATAVALVAAQSGLIGFGVKDGELKSRLAEAVMNGILPVYPNARAYYAGSAAARVAFVKAVAAAARGYSETAAFKADYAKRRAEAKPEDPGSKGSATDQVNAQQAEQRKRIEELKKQIPSLPANMQEQMKAMAKQMEDSLNQQASDPNQQAMVKQVYEQQAQEERARYQKDLAEWQQKYPENPNALIAARLKDFLAMTADVNFDAKLIAADGGRSRFADDQYEQKSSNWKICYRAGREPVAAARAAAQDWLRALGN